MPNTFASLMLMTWPLVCLLLLLRLPLERALVWCILGGYLLLPPVAKFDLPLVPAMDKESIPSLCAFLIVIFLLRRRIAPLPESKPGRALVILFVLAIVPTVLTNGEPAVYAPPAGASGVDLGGYRVPGLTLRDLLAIAVEQVIILLPFLMGRQFLASEKGLRELLLAMTVGGLAYSIPALIEVRLSPQLNIWIYGFFQHDFEQMMREGGFRPLVFLPHALWLALFMVSALVSCAVLTRRAAGAQRLKLLIATVYLAGVLYLCKSLASQLYAVAFLPLVLLGSPRQQVRVALLLALIAVAYPILRNAGLIPVEAILERAAAFDPDRAASLAYRLENEDLLLDRADRKPWFGWGGWGRNLVLAWDNGAILTIPDGRWIIVFGVYGWLGYIAEMGLLALPLLLLWWHSRGARPAQVSPLAAGVAAILAVTMIDMLLNATLIPLTWLCAGAVLGYAERLPHPARRDQPDRPTGKPARPLFGKGPAIGNGQKPPRTIM